MGHSLHEIEKDALGLSPEDRTRLAVRLISSLEESAEAPEEIEKLWIAESERRFQRTARWSRGGDTRPRRVRLVAEEKSVKEAIFHPGGSG